MQRGSSPPRNLLLKLRRKYEEAVKRFSPYDRLQEVSREARAAASTLIAEGTSSEIPRTTYMYASNRLEGNSLETIAAVVGEAEARANGV